MNAAQWAQAERQAFVDLAQELGPEAATLCEGWTVADLAAHLVLRERHPLAMPGVLLGGPFARYTSRVNDRLATGSFDELLQKIRSGPPKLLRRFDGKMNVAEFAIHLEDLRRARQGWEPRTGLDELQDLLWGIQGRSARLMTRKLNDINLTLARTSGETISAGKAGRPVTLIGEPLEVVLFVAGRRNQASVELTGDPAAVQEVKTGPLGY
jgi:uncharacterized protein (TIGR03085 family)